MRAFETFVRTACQMATINSSYRQRPAENVFPLTDTSDEPMVQVKYCSLTAIHLSILLWLVAYARPLDLRPDIMKTDLVKLIYGLDPLFPVLKLSSLPILSNHNPATTQQ